MTDSAISQTSHQASRVGCQQPTWRLAKEYSLTQAAFFVEFMKRLGVSLRKWQLGVINDWLAVDETGKYIHYRNGLETPRQNGKTTLIETRILPGAVLKGESFVYTAHDYSTVQMLFDRLKFYFGEKANDPKANFPQLNKLVKSVRSAVSKEAVFLKNGAAIYLATRTKSAKLGFTADVFIVDEAQELRNEHLEALLATISAAPLSNPQVIICGTVPTPNSKGDVFASIRYKARAGNETDLGWNEWSVDEPGDIMDVDRWYRVNPSLGQGLLETAILGEAASFTDPFTFAQIRLGYWLPERKEAKPDPVINRDDWQACITKQAPKLTGDEVPSFAVKFSIDGARATIAAAVKLPNGRIFVDIPTGCNGSSANGIKGIEQFLGSVSKSAAQIVIDGKSHSDDLEQRLLARKVSKRCIIMASTADIKSACSMFIGAIAEQELIHCAQVPVDYAVENTIKRKIGNDGGFGFEPTAESSDATILEAMALAYWAAKTTKRNPKGGVRIL